jgi:GNAT superfamily N-acetyltransferase
LRYVLTRHADEFAARTERLLSERLECNVLATVLRMVLDGGPRDPSPLFAYGLGDDGEARFAALRTPPWPLLASPLDQGADEFAARWFDADPDVPAVSSVPATAREIASAWARRSGGSTRCSLREAMHVLDEVLDPARPAPGQLRPGRETERDLLVRWMAEFADEAGLDADAEQTAGMVDLGLRGQGLMVWEDREPVSMLVRHPRVAGVVRIGPVYTPPAYRRRGYATSAVAAASRGALDEGARRCMLYTDVTNPTSNKIYAEIGYRRCGEWEVIALERAP